MTKRRKGSHSDEDFFFVRDQVGVIVPRPIPPIQYFSTSIQYSRSQGEYAKPPVGAFDEVGKIEDSEISPV